MRIRSLFPVALLSFAYLVSYPLVIGKADESHLLYGAKRLLDGEVIYDDFFESLTPLSFYLFAGIFRVAGTTLLAARVGIALVEALGCVLLFALVRRVSGTVEAVIAALVFAGLCVPAWPFASPHWISTTLGLLVAAIMLADRWQGSSRVRPLVAGLLTGTAFCVQQQRGTFLLLWLLVAASLLAISHSRSARWRALRTEVAWSMGGAALVILVVLGHAAWASSTTLLIDAIYEFPVKSYAPTTGGVGWAGVLPGAGEWAPNTWLLLLRVSPLILVLEGLRLAARLGRAWTPDELVRACLWLLATFMALSIWYLPDYIHVSFVLPFMLIPAAALLHDLRAATVWERAPGARGAMTVAMWALVLVLVGKCAANLTRAYASAPMRFATAFGPLRGDAATDRLLRAVRSHLVDEPGGRSLLFSYPDAAFLYLALGVDDATRFDIVATGFSPPEHIDEVVEVLRRRRPGTVVLLTPFATDPVGRAIDEWYDAVEDVSPFRIYVRRGVAGG